jgi:hypothetical protein
LRGWYTPSGEQKEAARQFYDLCARCEKIETDLAHGPQGASLDLLVSTEDVRRMAVELLRRDPKAFTFAACFDDGTMLSDARATAPPLPPDALGLPPAPTVTLLDAHPSDLAAPQPEPIPVAPRTIDVEAERRSEATRRWFANMDMD